MMSKADEKLIVDFLTEMTTQNNRITAHPYYYVIRHPEYMQSESCGDDPNGRCERGKTIYVSKEEPEISYESRADLKASLIEDSGLTGLEADTAIEDEYEPYELVLLWRESGMFLTESDAESHLKKNHYHYGQGAHTYVKHAWRAPQMDSFFKALFNHFGVERRVPSDPPV
jgi:hypothetical protein